MNEFPPHTAPSRPLERSAIWRSRYSAACMSRPVTQNRSIALPDSVNRGSMRWLPHLLSNAILAFRASTMATKAPAGHKIQQSDDDMELGLYRPDTTPFLHQETSTPSSLRSSLDNDYYQSQGCEIHIYDDISSNQSTPSAASNWELDASTWHGGLDSREGLTKQLKVALLRISDEYRAYSYQARDPRRTRWM